MLKYLTTEERILIEWELKQGHSLSKIARRCNRPHATIIYEISTKSYRSKAMTGVAIEKVKKSIANHGVKLNMAQHWDLLINVDMLKRTMILKALA